MSILARTAWLSSVLLTAAGCSQGPDVINAFFTDELIEAPARTASVHVVSGADCSALLTQPHESTPPSAQLVLDRSVPYPINPETEILATLPRGATYTFSVAALDRDSMIIGRGCSVATLAAGDAVTIDVEISAQPVCADVPTHALDLVLVIDTSNDIAVADPARAYLSELQTRVVRNLMLPAGSTWSIVTHGAQGMVQTTLPPTASVDDVNLTLDGLRTVTDGRPLVIDGMVRATGQLRARAVCGRRPAILTVLGGFDNGSKKTLEEAILGLTGSRDDSRDDVFAYGLGLSEDAYTELSDIIPEGIGVPTGAVTLTLMQSKLTEAAQMIRALLN